MNTATIRPDAATVSPLRFDDVVDVTITVAKLGRSSITYLIEVRKGETVAASGRLVAVFIDRESGR